LKCFGRRQPGVTPHHVLDHGALIIRYTELSPTRFKNLWRD
jgi:hypothetical protein